MVAVCVLAFTGCGSKSAKLYDYDLSEYVTLGEYKGIEVPPYDVEITAEDIDAEIETILAAAAYDEEITEGTVEKGDRINIDYVGTVDGEEFAGGSTNGNGTVIILGEAGYIEGFEAGLYGAAIGDTLVLDLRFPDNYHNTDLAGKDCVFTVTVNSKLNSVKPDYDLNFVRAHSECQSLNEYEQMIYEQLLGEAMDIAQYERENLIWNTIVADSEVIKYPEKEVKDVKKSYSDYLDSMIAYSGYTKEQYLEIVDMTEEEFDTELQNYAEEVVKNEMVLYAIARTEGIELTDEEYADGLIGLLEQQGFSSDEEFKALYGASFEEYMTKESITTTLLLEKVMDFLLEQVVETTEA